MGTIIDCSKINETILNNIKSIEAEIPTLYFITSETSTPITFDDVFSVAKQVNINCENINVSTSDGLIQTIKSLVQDENCYGIYVNDLHHSLLSKKINFYSLLSPMKDVSAKNIISTGLINYDHNLIYPPYITIVLRLLQELDLSLSSLPVTIIDFEDEMSSLLAGILSKKGCTVTICNKYTKNLRKYMKYNDLIISLINDKYKFLSSSIKENSIFINLDVNYNNVEDVKNIVKFYTESKDIKQLYITYILYNFVKLLQLE